MSVRNLILVLLLVLPMGFCKAQSATARPVEPTAIGIIYHLDSASNEFKKLPDEQWKQASHITGMNTMTYSIQVSRDRSSFRLKVGDKLEFVFKTGSPEKVSLYRFDQKSNKRRFDYEKGHGRNGDSGLEPIKGLSVEVSKFGESSYALVPASALTPGEYAIMIAGEVYTFGVD
jgi:Cu/Ag efflux protein CusF